LTGLALEAPARLPGAGVEPEAPTPGAVGAVEGPAVAPSLPSDFCFARCSCRRIIVADFYSCRKHNLIH